MNKYLKLAIIASILILLACNKYVWVSDLDYLEPVYKVKPSQVVKIDTIQTRYERIYKVKYR